MSETLKQIYKFHQYELKNSMMVFRYDQLACQSGRGHSQNPRFIYAKGLPSKYFEKNKEK